MNLKYFYREDKSFIIKTYGVNELACVYSPNVTPNSATRRLKQWINYNMELRKKLLHTGWTQTCRVFTPKQVQLLVEYLGEP